MTRPALAPLLLLVLAACSEKEAATLPAPVAMSDDTVAYYCHMPLIEHPGPKGQIHLDGVAEPIFFSQARDTIAYLRMPERDHAVLAAYVSDMGAAKSWEQPGRDNWILAAKAFYVVGSSRVGGMGAPELVPFGKREAADAFVREYGGLVRRLDEIEDALVLSPVDMDADKAGTGQQQMHQTGSGEE